MNCSKIEQSGTMTTEYEDSRDIEPVIHWSECLGNPWLQPFHPAMLDKDGYRILRVTRIAGESRQDPPICRWILYDRDYVFQRLKYLLEPLGVSESQILTLLEVER